MTFVQIIEFRTADITAARQIDEDWVRATKGKRTAFYDLDVLQVRVYAPLFTLTGLAVPPERCGQ